MQIKAAFKAILARKINIKGCEDYENTFAHMESDCMLRFGFKALIKSILCTKQANLFLHFLRTSQRFSHPFMLILRAKIALNEILLSRQ